MPRRLSAERWSSLASDPSRGFTERPPTDAAAAAREPFHTGSAAGNINNIVVRGAPCIGISIYYVVRPGRRNESTGTQLGRRQADVRAVGTGSTAPTVIIIIIILRYKCAVQGLCATGGGRRYVVGVCMRFFPADRFSFGKKRRRRRPVTMFSFSFVAHVSVVFFFSRFRAMRIIINTL